MMWIKPNDKLPKPISMVLVWTNTCLQPTMCYYTGKDWLYMTPLENFWLSKQPHIEILFWMELPQPPFHITNDIYDISNMD